jgi:hypothetical protein
MDNAQQHNRREREECACTLIAEKDQSVIFLNLQRANIGSFIRLGIPQPPRPYQHLPISL